MVNIPTVRSLNNRMRLRSRLLLGGLAAVLFAVLAVSLLMFPARPMALSICVHRYVRQTERLCAFLVLSNAAATPLAVPLRFQCQVERAGSSTNYIADTRYTIFLREREETTLSQTNYAIPLPVDADRWKVRFQIRRQTARERFVSALYSCGIRNWAFLSRLSGPPRKDEEFKWTRCESSVFEVGHPPISKENQ